MSETSFSADLRAFREARNLSLTDLQRETRIPADVIQRLESGSLLTDDSFHDVYRKNLLKEYARAVEAPASEVLNSYELVLAGRYNGELREVLNPGSGRKESSSPAPAMPESQDRPSMPDASAGAAAGPPAVEALSTLPESEPEDTPQPTPASTEYRPNEHFPKRRVKSESAASASRPIERSWALIIGIAVLSVVLIGGALWLMMRDDSGLQPVQRPDQAEAEQPPDDTETAEARAAQEQQPVAGAGPRLQTPIEVTVIATGTLGNFRVTQEPDSRRPYWLEQGESETFRSDSMIVLWGQGDSPTGLGANVRLRMQGIEWTPTPGQVLRIDRQRGQRILDSLHTAGGGQAVQPQPQPQQPQTDG
ncbi:helix-turn-helix domain-containing protein [soil metagenome]